MTTRLLWADADAEFTFIGQRYLAASGFDVTVTNDAVDCLKQMKRTMPDVVVLDDELNWGGVDGLLAWLREEVPLDDQPVLILSGDEAAGTISARTGIPEARCLQKPYRMRSILEAATAETNRCQGDGRQRHECIVGGIEW
jgi:DNA-binding response OmpR family regulator